MAADAVTPSNNFSTFAVNTLHKNLKHCDREVGHCDRSEGKGQFLIWVVLLVCKMKGGILCIFPRIVGIKWKNSVISVSKNRQRMLVLILFTIWKSRLKIILKWRIPINSKLSELPSVLKFTYNQFWDMICVKWYFSAYVWKWKLGNKIDY